MRVHETWFCFLALCDCGQCIPSPFYGRQRSVTIKSISLWRAHVLGDDKKSYNYLDMPNNLLYASKKWNNPRYRREGHTVNGSVQQNTVHIPHAALLALNNKHIFDTVWTCLRFLTMYTGNNNREIIALFFLFFTLAMSEPFPWGITEGVGRRVAVIVRL